MATPLKILLIHNFYQQFGGEDLVALQDTQVSPE